MEAVYKSRTSNEGGMECFIIKAGHKFWFSAEDIACVLDYIDSDDVCLNVRPETWIKWGELNSSKVEMEQVPSYWILNTILISDVGLLRLLCKSTKSESREFERWMFDDVLPILRVAGQFKLEKSYLEQLATKDKDIKKLRNRVIEFYGHVAFKMFE